MERSSSFRNSMEHPVLSSHPNMLRSTSSITQTDVINFFQCLRFDPKVVAADHKSIRQGDFKRHINVALGIMGDESPNGTLRGKPTLSPIPEEIKRLKAGLRENSVKARERVKIFNEASSVFNKFFPSIPTKKRSRPEGFGSDRASDRSVLGPNLGKPLSQTVAGGSETDQQKSAVRSKSAVPNKRTRTSMMDVRSNAIVRHPVAVDRNKETARLVNSSAVQGEDRTSSTGVDGWEKSKLKKKRSGVKTGASPGLVSNIAVDGYREIKTLTQQKSANDFRSRLNGDSHLLRQANANGATGFGRSDNASQQTGLAGRSSLPRADNDLSSLSIEKRELSTSSDKNRPNLRAVNKTSVHEDFNSPSPSLSTKINASFRGPRSGSGLPPKLSPTVHNATSPSDWDISSCTSKPPTSSGVSNRKRTISKRSSSPPVTQWCGQRPQKISRTARRTNFIPIISNNDENLSSENTSDIGCNEMAFGFPRRSPGASPQQVKIKGESSLSAAALSESEESGQPEIKSKDKGKQCDEVDEKTVQNAQILSTPTLPLKKNTKLVSGDELGDGARRQGRMSRGFASTRSLAPVGMEKLSKAGTAKQLRSARNVFDKTESKAGRPPSRKLSDRKAYKRLKHTEPNTKLDFLDDGHEELLAAVNAAINSAQNFSSSYWKQMEPYFRFISDEDIAYLKQQTVIRHDQYQSSSVKCLMYSMLYMRLITPELSEIDLKENLTYSDPSKVTSLKYDISEEDFLSRKRDSLVTPLYQRLLAALISEDSGSTNEEYEVDEFGAITELNDESEFIGMNHMVEYNGYRTTQELEHDDSEDDIAGINNSNQYSNGGFSDHLPVEFSNLPHNNLGIDEKVYLEARCIGICIEPGPSISSMEDELISHDISKLEVELRDKASNKKGFINRLLKTTLETKMQEKEFDLLGYEKLVEIAHEKYKASRRHHTASAKNAGTKISKQTALAFVKRTLDIYHEYEDTGKSCFSDPMFRDMFVSGFAPTRVPPTDGESAQPASGLLPNSTMTSQTGLTGDRGFDPSDLRQPETSLMQHSTDREDTIWSNKIKNRELLLDDVGIGSSLPSGTKGKRSERDKDGKGQTSSRNGTNRIGRPSTSDTKSERKSKAKPNKQKSTQISSTSVKISEQPRSAMASNGNLKDNNEFNLDEPLDLSHLQIPDGLGGPDDFDTQPQDLGSWLNIDDDAFQDLDLMGLQIPMDDLSELNMMV